MLFAGILGGTANSIISEIDEPWKKIWLKSCLLGITAAFLTPLFLSTISSNLLVNILTKKLNFNNYFIFFGFALLASISARVFIGNLTASVMKIAKKADKKADIAIDAISEQEPEEVNHEIASQQKLSTNQQELLNSLSTNPKYKLRTATGLSKELNQPKEVVLEDLKDLKALGLVKKNEVKNGIRWSSTGEVNIIASSNSSD